MRSGAVTSPFGPKVRASPGRPLKQARRRSWRGPPWQDNLGLQFSFGWVGIYSERRPARAWLEAEGGSGGPRSLSSACELVVKEGTEKNRRAPPSLMARPRTCRTGRRPRAAGGGGEQAAPRGPRPGRAARAPAVPAVSPEHGECLAAAVANWRLQATEQGRSPRLPQRKTL